MNENEIRDALVARVDELVGPRAAPPPFAEPRRYSPRVWLSVAAAVLLVAAVAVTVTVVAHRRGTPPSTGPHVDPHYTLTVQRVEKALATTPVLPSARRYDRSPDPKLDEPGEQPQNGARGIQRSAWWSAPGDAAVAVHYFKTHTPSGFTVSGTGAISNRTGVIEKSIMYDGGAGGNDAATSGLTVTVTIARYANGVAVRADVYAEWIPTRSASSRIDDPRSVVVWVARGGVVPAVRRVLTGADTRRLAQVVNDALPFPSGTFNCPMQRTDFWDSLRFTTPHGTVTVRVTVSGCNRAQLKTPGQTPLGLEGYSIDQTILKTLGLPKDYGY